MKKSLFIVVIITALYAHHLTSMESSAQKWESPGLQRQQLEREWRQVKKEREHVERERQQLRKNNAVYTLLTAFPSGYEAAHDIVREFPEAVNTYVELPDSHSGYDKATPLHFCSDPHMLEILLKAPDVNCYLRTEKNKDTVLHVTQDKRIARQFIGRGAFINQVNRWGEIPLSRALTGGNEKYAHFLVKNGALVDSCNGDGKSLLLRAVIAKNPKNASFLLRHGADPMKQDNAGDTPISLVLQERDPSMIRCFAENGWFICPKGWEPEYSINKLLCKKALLLRDFRRNKHDKPVLLTEAITTLAQFFISMLQRQSDNESKLGFVPDGCYFNNVSKGALSKCYGDEALTYVDKFLYGRYKSILKSLQKVDEWTDEQSSSLATVLTANPFLLMYDKQLTFDALNHSMQNNGRLFKQLVGAQVNLKGKDSNGNNLLHLAVLRKNRDAVRDLIVAGIDVSEWNNARETAFELSRRIGCDGIFYDLVKQDFCMPKNGQLHKGLKRIIKERNFYPNISDAKGRNLLFDVVEKKALSQGAHLINSGIDVNYADKEGTTPLEYALAQGWSEGVALLLDSGAAKVPHKLLQYAHNIEYYARYKLYEEYVRQGCGLPVH